MYVSNPGHPVVIVTDWRQRHDSLLDDKEPSGAPHVLEFWKMGQQMLGRAWNKVTRIALFDHGDTPSAADARVMREQWSAYVRTYKPPRIFVVPTPDSSMGAEAVHLKGTHCLMALSPPDTLQALRGTRWEVAPGVEVTPCYAIAKRVKQLEHWQMAQWLRRAGKPTLRLAPERQCIEPSEKIIPLMRAMYGRPLSIDLEFHPNADIVTAIGLSDGRGAVSIPWDEYHPRGNGGAREKGIDSYCYGSWVRECLAELFAANTPKVAHNFVADIPRLNARGFTVNGPMHDTFAAHAIAFPELRHGLQAACVTYLDVPPWKSLYKPSHLAKGITRDDAEYWVADPEALRNYNCLDAFYTWHLASHVLPEVGIRWEVDHA